MSTATVQLSAQVEEVVASAATLADMAGELDALVDRFVLDHGSGGTRDVNRLRASDWQKPVAAKALVRADAARRVRNAHSTAFRTDRVH